MRQKGSSQRSSGCRAPAPSACSSAGTGSTSRGASSERCSAASTRTMSAAACASGQTLITIKTLKSITLWKHAHHVHRRLRVWPNPKHQKNPETHYTLEARAPCPPPPARLPQVLTKVVDMDPSGDSWNLSACSDMPEAHR